MEIFSNHCWCNDSNWNGATYDCRYILTIRRSPDLENIYDTKSGESKDWEKCITREKVLDQQEYDFLKKDEVFKDYPDEDLKKMCRRTVFCLKDDIIEYLINNVKDREDEEINEGWAVHNAPRDLLAYDIFFHRKEDALAFIKEFSEYKVPTLDTNYFEDTTRKYNPKTGKLGPKKDR